MRGGSASEGGVLRNRGGIVGEDRPVRTYCHGDEIRMRMTFTHDGHISAVEVVYLSHADPTHALTLSGNPDPVEGSPLAGKGKPSTVELTATVDETLLVGEYNLQRVTVFSFVGGTDVGLEGGPPNWPTLYIDYGWPNVRDVSIELEPDE